MGFASEGSDPITGANGLCVLCWEGHGWLPPPHPGAVPIRFLQFTPGVNLKPERQDAVLTRKGSWTGAGCVGWEINERGGNNSKRQGE